MTDVEAEDLRRVSELHELTAAALGRDALAASVAGLEALKGPMGRGMLTRSLHPCWVTHRQYERSKRASAALARVVARLGRRAMLDEALRRQIGWAPSMDWLIAVDGDSPAPRFVGRVDGLLDERGHYRVLEYNASLPGGIAHSDRLARTFSTSPAVLEVASTRRTEWPCALPPAVDALHRLEAPRGPLSLGLVSPEPIDLDRADEADSDLLLDLVELRARGVPVTCGSADDLSIDARGVRLGGRDVDVLVVPPLADMVARVAMRLGADPGVHRELVRSGRFLYFNGLALSVAMSSKLLLAVASDERRERWLDGVAAEDLALVRQVLPWSRRLVDEPTELDGRTVPLVETVRKHRERFVLKPAFGHGGKNVLLGSTCDAATWEDAIAGALEVGDGLVQELVGMATLPWTMLSGAGAATAQRVASSLDLFVWKDEIAAGGISRTATEAGMLNVSLGAQLAPICVVE